MKKVYIISEYHNNYDYGGDSRDLSYHRTYYSAVIGLLRYAGLSVSKSTMEVAGRKGCIEYDQFHGIEINEAEVEELTMEEVN